MNQNKSTDFLKALEVFLAVAETRNMTAAARALGLAQSAVSQMLQQVEAELGQSLFDRTVRPLCLTSAGAILQTRAVQLLADAAETRSLLREFGSGTLPHLRLAVIGSLAGTLVPPLISALGDQLRIKQISVWRGQATTRENALINRDVDMLVTSDALPEITGLDQFPLFTEPYVAIMPKGAMPDGAATAISDLSDKLPFIRYTHKTQIGWAVETQLKRMGVNVPLTLEFDSAEDVIALVSAGRGWAVSVPSHILQTIRDPAAIEVVPFPGPRFSRSVNLVVRKGELGTIPQDVHAICLDILKRDFAAGVHKLIPWLKEDFKIASL